MDDGSTNEKKPKTEVLNIRITVRCQRCGEEHELGELRRSGFNEFFYAAPCGAWRKVTVRFDTLRPGPAKKRRRRIRSPLVFFARKEIPMLAVRSHP